MTRVLIVQAIPPETSSTHYVHAAMERLGVLLKVAAEPGDDVLGSLVVRPHVFPTDMPHPVAVLLNDRMSRRPAAWARELYNYADRLFSINLPELLPGMEEEKVEWLPGAYEPMTVEVPAGDCYPLTYVGTFNAWRKVRFLRAAADAAPLRIFGNGWEQAPSSLFQVSSGPCYGYHYAETLRASVLAINVLQSRWGPNRKVFEVPHHALMLYEAAPGVQGLDSERSILKPKSGWMCAFQTPDGLADAIRYYTDNPSEVERHRREQAAQVEPYTYDAQAKRLLRFFEEGCA